MKKQLPLTQVYSSFESPQHSTFNIQHSIFIGALCSMLLAPCPTLHAQNVGINEDGSDPNNKALLDVKSTSKGVLFPRMTMAQRDVINPASSENGLLIYQTDNTPGFRYYDSLANSWKLLIPAVAILRHEEIEAIGAGGGPGSKWFKRKLNVHEGDTTFLDLKESDSTFFLDPGGYIIEAAAGSRGGEGQQTRLWNEDDTQTEIVGTTGFQSPTQQTHEHRSFILGEVRISSKSAFSLQQWNVTAGQLGFAISNTEPNAFVIVKITKLE